jgi:hypothetical protein
VGAGDLPTHDRGVLDARLLTDRSRCPACAAALTAEGACGRCGVPLTGPTAAQVWSVSVLAAQFLAQREELVAQLRREARAPAPAPAVGPPATGQPATGQPATGQPVGAAGSTGGPEWAPPRIQNVLLGLGVLLLAAAAVIFVVVSWQRGGVAARAVSMATASVLAVVGGAEARRRGMSATAEAFGAVAVVLVVLDGYALRRGNVGGLGDGSAATYWSAAFAVIALLAVAGAAVLPLRAWRLTAAAVGQLPLLVVAGHLGTVSRWPAFAVGLTLAVQAAGQVVLTAALRGRVAVRDGWYVLAGSVPVTWLAALVAALVAAYTGAGGHSVAGAALLLGLGLIGVLAAWLGRDAPGVRHGACAAATAAVLLAAWTPAQAGLGVRWQPPTLAGLGLAGLLVAGAVGRRWRPGAVAVSAAAVLLAAQAGLEATAVAVAGPVGWLGRPWTSPGTGTARDLVGTGLQWTAGTELSVLLAVLAAAALVAGRVAGRSPGPQRAGEAAAVAVLAAALTTLPYVAGLSYRVAVGSDLTVAAVGLAVGLAPGSARWVEVRRTATVSGAVLGASTLAWSLATPVVAVAAYGAALVGLLVGLMFSARLRHPACTVLAVLLAGVETAAVARSAGAGAGLGGLAVGCLGAAVVAGAAARLRPDHGMAAEATGAVAYLVGAAVAATGPQWMSVVTVAAGALAAGTGAWRSRTPLRVAWAAAAAVLCCLLALAVGRWAGLGPAGSALAVAVTAAVLAPAGIWLAGRLIPRSEPVETVAVAGYAFAVVALAGDPRQLWLALLAGAAGAGLAAVHPERRSAGWAAGLLAAGSSWVRLAEANVSAPEAYTAPLGTALVIAGYLRRRADRDLPSWPAYGLGLSLILGPSLLRAGTDPGLGRPLVLGAVALGVLLVGAIRRLQAPLILGGATLGADALVQLAPYLAATYAALPRWVTIGSAGLLLLGIGASYERRLRELRRLRDNVGQLH